MALLPRLQMQSVRPLAGKTGTGAQVAHPVRLSRHALVLSLWVTATAVAGPPMLAALRNEGAVTMVSPKSPRYWTPVATDPAAESGEALCMTTAKYLAYTRAYCSFRAKVKAQWARATAEQIGAALAQVGQALHTLSRRMNSWQSA